MTSSPDTDANVAAAETATYLSRVLTHLLAVIETATRPRPRGSNYRAPETDEETSLPTRKRYPVTYAPQTPQGHYAPSYQPQNELGTAALVLGIIAAVFAFIPIAGIFIAIPLAVLATIFGTIGIVRAVKGRATNKGSAISGTALGAFAFILTIVMTAAVFGTATTPAPTQPVAGGAKGGESGGANQLAGIGGTVTDGNLAFTVTRVETAQTLGEGFMATEAQGKFVLVTLTVQNIGREAATFNAGPSQVAYDADGREYSTSADAIMSGNPSDMSSFLQQINPGATVEGRLVYDVPEDVKLVKVHLQGGTFTPGVEVSLK